MTTTELLESFFNEIEGTQLRKAFSEAIILLAEQSKTNDDHGPDHIQVLTRVQDTLLDIKELIDESKKTEKHFSVEPYEQQKLMSERLS